MYDCEGWRATRGNGEGEPNRGRARPATARVCTKLPIDTESQGARGEAVASECTGAKTGPGGATTQHARATSMRAARRGAHVRFRIPRRTRLSAAKAKGECTETFWHGKFGDQKTVQKVGTGKITGNNERRGEEIYSYICGRLPVPVAAWLKPTNHRTPSHYFAVTS